MSIYQNNSENNGKWDKVPLELKKRLSWVCWRSENQTKVPYKPASKKPIKARTTDPKDWATFDSAKNSVGWYGHTGIGIVLTGNLVGIDLDDCVDKNGQLSLFAQTIVNALDSYTEISPSGTGIKIWCLGKWGDRPNHGPGIEVYDKDRYFTVTGRQLKGTPLEVNERQHQLDKIFNLYFPKDIAEKKTDVGESVDHSEMCEACQVPLEERQARATAYLEEVGGTQSGANADKTCYAHTLKVLWGFLVPAEIAQDVLEEWGRRTDQIDASGKYDPWTSSQIAHKIEMALKFAYENPGNLLTSESGLRSLEREAEERILSEQNQMVKTDQSPKTPLNPIQQMEVDIQKKEADKTTRKHALLRSELEQLPPFKWLIKNHLRNGSYNFVYGAYNVGKTFYALDMAMSVATGQNFLGAYPVRKTGIVVYVCSEGVEDVKERIEAWEKHHNLPPVQNIAVIGYSFRLNVEEEARELIKIIQNDVLKPLGTQDVAFVVIDTLARNLGGSDNDPTDMGEFVRQTDFIKKKLDTTILVVHHSGKDETKGMRGHTSAPGAADTIIALSGSAEDVIHVKADKQKGRGKFFQYDLVAKSVFLKYDEIEDEDIASLVLIPCNKESAIMNYLKNNTEQRELVENLYCSFSNKQFTLADCEKFIKEKTSRHRRLNTLIENGILECDKSAGERKTHYYSFSEAGRSAALQLCQPEFRKGLK